MRSAPVGAACPWLSSFSERTCAVGEKGAMAGIADGVVTLALATPTMRGLT